MLTQFLANNVLLVTVIWIAIYLSDYYMTIMLARFYRGGANEHLVIEGSLELTPAFQKDVDALRLVSRPFFIRLVMSCVGIWLVWWWFVSFMSLPAFFSFLIGALTLREAAVHMRHARNWYTFRVAQRAGAMSGQVKYSRWFSLQLSAVELASFAVLFLLLSILAREWFLAGGVLGCAQAAFEHWRLARSARQTVSEGLTSQC